MLTISHFVCYSLALFCHSGLRRCGTDCSKTKVSLQFLYYCLYFYEGLEHNNVTVILFTSRREGEWRKRLTCDKAKI